MTISKLYLKYFCFSIFLLLFSCVDKDLELYPGEKGPDFEGDVINFTFTLDKLGGPSTRDGSAHPVAQQLEVLENYVDLTKIRVLFFDDEDKFLFESKSRWTKLLEPKPDHGEWSVSVPLYTYGNDKDYDWEWSKIRKKLTSGSFKIAILANRPLYQYYPDLDNGSFMEYWYDNSKPDWKRNNSSVYVGAGKDVKDVFDLHHSQFDPIYWNKSIETNGGGYAYDFIMGGEFSEGQALLSATSSWLDFTPRQGTTQTGNRKDPYGWNLRYARMPSEDDPIPMYGIQQYDALTDWKEGTTIDLNVRGEKPISLLRSIVKLEIVIPTNFANDVVLFYGNWFARCEPLDVWTPTDQIWSDVHGDSHNWDEETYCEWKKIWDQGTIADSGKTNGISDYKKSVSWQYGLWRLEKKWSFDDHSVTKGLDANFDAKGVYKNDPKKFPRIFNTCIQRIQRVMVPKAYNDGDGDHYIVYCGERNINDPSNLTEPANNGAGASTLLYWTLIKGVIKDVTDNRTQEIKNTFDNPITKEYTSGTTYSFPMVDYNYADKEQCTRKGQLRTFTVSKKINNVESKSYTASLGPDNSDYSGNPYGNGMGDYLRSVANHENSKGLRPGYNYKRSVGDNLPLPLLRNHVYTIKLTNTTNVRSNSEVDFDDLTFSSQVSATENICFKNNTQP